jgi:hypothetical protein
MLFSINVITNLLEHSSKIMKLESDKRFDINSILQHMRFTFKVTFAKRMFLRLIQLPPLLQLSRSLRECSLCSTMVHTCLKIA